jgi:hypothetical protein
VALSSLLRPVTILKVCSKMSARPELPVDMRVANPSPYVWIRKLPNVVALYRNCSLPTLSCRANLQPHLPPDRHNFGSVVTTH